MEVPEKTKKKLLYDLSIALLGSAAKDTKILGSVSKDTKIQIQKVTCTPKYIALSTIAKLWREPK